MLRPVIRANVRQLVGDTSAAPLWSDAEVNAAISRAILRYGAALPQRLTAVTSAVSEGARSVGLPASVIARTICAVRDPLGNEIPPVVGAAVEPRSGYRQGWWAWAGSLRLQAPVSSAEAGVWSVDYWGPRLPIDDETSAQPVDPGDDRLVSLLAAADLVDVRRSDDAKRGQRGSWPDFAGQAEREIVARKRRVQSSVFTGG